MSNGEEKAAHTLRLIDCLKQSVEIEDADYINGPGKPESPNMVSLADVRAARQEAEERDRRQNLTAAEATPAEVLAVALQDVADMGTVTKAYITLIRDDGQHWSTHNYRAGLTRAEELAFRQLATQELLDGWRGRDY